MALIIKDSHVSLQGLQPANFFSILYKMMSFLVSTSIFLAISGSFKVIFSELLFNTFNIYIPILAFLSTFGVYGLNKLTDLKEDVINNPERANTIRKIKVVFKLTVALSFVLSLVLGFLVDFLTIPVLIFPLFLGTLYSLKLSKNLPRLKEIRGVKNLTIALSWSVGSTFLPVIHILEKKEVLIILIFYLFFTKSLINSILFDIRDIEGDRKSNIRTIPIFLGKDKTKRLLLILNSTFIPWLIIANHAGFFHGYFLVLLFLIFYAYWYILHFSGEINKIGKSIDLFVDGEFIIIAIFALATRI